MIRWRDDAFARIRERRAGVPVGGVRPRRARARRRSAVADRLATALVHADRGRRLRNARAGPAALGYRARPREAARADGEAESRPHAHLARAQVPVDALPR